MIMSLGEGRREAGAPEETIGFRNRLRTRLFVVMALSGGVLLATGGVGLHYVDEVGQTLRRSTEITAPLLSDVLEMTQAGRRVRASVHAAAEQCTGLDAARGELQAFEASSSVLLRNLRARAERLKAESDLDRIADVENRFVTIGENILGTCVRTSMLVGRIMAAGDAVQADIADMAAIADTIEEKLTLPLRTGDEPRRHERNLFADLSPLTRLRSDLGGFIGIGELVSALNTGAAVSAFEIRRTDKLRDLTADVERLRPVMGEIGMDDDHGRLIDLVADLADRVVGGNGLMTVQRALTDARATMAAQRLELGTIDDDYFRSVRGFEETARRLDRLAQRQVVTSTREAYVAVATTSLVLLLFALATALDVARRVTVPIERFTDHVRRLRGLEDLERPLCRTLVRRTDEIGLLARSFARLTNALSDARRRLEAEAEARILRQYDRLQSAIATMPQGFYLLDSDERLVVWNDSLLHMYGLRPGEVTVGMPITAVVERTRELGVFLPAWRTEPLFRRAMTDHQPYQRVDELPDGRTIVVTASPTSDGGVAVTHEDVTSRRRVEAEIEQLVRFDTATGLANRTSFQDRIGLALSEREEEEQIALLYVDLDHFKTVNDSLGHKIGDRLLAEVAARIIECTGEWDHAGRLGGDEFAVLQTRLFQPMAATDLARRLHESISQPYDIDGAQIVVGASIGIAVAPDDALAADTLLAHADMALYRAKSEGRGITRFFEPEMDAHMQMRRMLELDLRGALERNEFELHYQPVVGAASARIEGFEALLRWRHPERGLVSPVDFIPVAEEIGLIGDIGAWVLREATRVAAGWPEDLRIAVNISPVQIKTRALVLDVLAAIGRSGLRPDRLELEITEGMLLVDTEATLATLAQFRDIGVRIAMDDFGTGYSSLGYLRRFAFDKVKIDQSFVRGLGETADSVAIVRAVTSLCSSLGITTTAEGVETEAQRDRLRLEGCDQFQGWLYGRPMPEAEVAAHLAAQTDTVGSSVFSIRHPRGRHGH
jgi:diguanylate cyclase (GGDEF)-like protein